MWRGTIQIDYLTFFPFTPCAGKISRPFYLYDNCGKGGPVFIIIFTVKFRKDLWRKFELNRPLLSYLLPHYLVKRKCSPIRLHVRRSLFHELLFAYLLWTHAQRCVHVIFCRCFFNIFFILAALVGQTAERIFTKLSHVVDIRCYLRTY